VNGAACAKTAAASPFLLVNPSDPQSFDRFAEQYDAAAALERRHDFFLQNLPERRDVALDVGCGTGLLAHALSAHFRFVVAVDISEPMLALARRNRTATNIDYRRADASDLRLDARFDAIVSHTTLHHLADPSRALTALKSSLRPGGRLLLVDCVTRFPAAIPRLTIFYWAFASLRFCRDLIRRNTREALVLFRFNLSRRWIAHLQSDRYLSRAELRALCARELPGAQCVDFANFVGIVWTAPAAGAALHPAPAHG